MHAVYFCVHLKIGNLIQYNYIRFGKENVADILYKDSLKEEKNELTVYVVKLLKKITGGFNLSLLISFF